MGLGSRLLGRSLPHWPRAAGGRSGEQLVLVAVEAREGLRQTSGHRDSHYLDRIVDVVAKGARSRARQRPVVDLGPGCYGVHCLLPAHGGIADDNWITVCL